MSRQVFKLTEVQRLLKPQSGMIITSDEEMRVLGSDPLAQVRAFDGRMGDLVERLRGNDGALINIAYDFFFGGEVREYFPTSPECVRAFKALHDVAREAGVGFGASVLSPLDLGPAYYREKGRGAGSRQFQEGALAPDGSFNVPVRVQRRWFHNKGPNFLHLKGVRVFAFDEERLGDSHYYYVDPANLLEISESAELTIDESTNTVTSAGFGYAEGVVHGRTAKAGGRSRVLVVLRYETEEIDYFHPDALPWVKKMLDDHKAAGIRYDSFYSDEMHIQFDWDLDNHFGVTEITTRHMTPSFEAVFADKFGAQYKDFDRWLVYFAYAQHRDLQPVGTEPEPAQHVWGKSEADVYAVWKFRRDYYRILIDHVVDMFNEAKAYGEEIFGHDRIWTRAHATWQEAPTCDHTNAAWAPESAPRSRYDYTPAYDWSSSIRENVSACYDYFRWGDFLTGMGTDHPEGGYLDRNYYGAALALAWGSYNDVPYGYYGHWGSPKEVAQRVLDASAAWGINGRLRGESNAADHAAWVQGYQHRKTNVLAIYPLELNYVEERFGSWMVQYGYCDWLTAEKLAEWGQVKADGRLEVRGCTYDTVVVLYAPILPKKTLKALATFAERGGRLLWTGPGTAVYAEDGACARDDWAAIFGITQSWPIWNGIREADAEVNFEGSLKEIPSYKLLTGMLPDALYPVKPAEGSEVIARVQLAEGSHVIGVRKGSSVYLGARPRDDQSGSIEGEDAPRTLYRLLEALGAYQPAGIGWPEWKANNSDYLVAESPNGAVAITHHYRGIREAWTGGFFRKEDKPYESPDLPPVCLDLCDEKVGPYQVSYQGDRVVTFRTIAGSLVAFAGDNTTGIKVDGRCYKLSDAPADVTYTVLDAEHLEPGVTQAWLVYVRPRQETAVFDLHLPCRMPEDLQWAADPFFNGRGEPQKANVTVKDGETTLHIPKELQGVPLIVWQER